MKAAQEMSFFLAIAEHNNLNLCVDHMSRSYKISLKLIHYWTSFLRHAQLLFKNNCNLEKKSIGIIFAALRLVVSISGLLYFPNSNLRMLSTIIFKWEWLLLLPQHGLCFVIPSQLIRWPMADQSPIVALRLMSEMM